MEAGASRRLMEDIRLAAAALRQNILAVGGPDTPLLDTLDQGDLTTRLHKFRVSQQQSLFFFLYEKTTLAHWPLSFPIVVSVACTAPCAVCWLLLLLFPHGQFAENSFGYAFLPPVSRLTLYLSRTYSKCCNIY